MTLSIRNGSVCVLSSSCPKKICMRTGAVRLRGQQIVCAPNHILVEIETSKGKLHRCSHKIMAYGSGC